MLLKQVVARAIRRPWWRSWRRWGIQMFRVSLGGLIIAALALGAGSATFADDGHVFLLSRNGNTFDLERVPIADGEMRVFQSTPETGIIDIILPVGPGGSGSVAQTNTTRMLIVRNVGGEMHASVQDAGGNKHDYPNRPMSELRQFDTRLSVISDDGAMANFTITKYEDAQIDTVGPVMDLFAGAIPLNKGDYEITMHTQQSAGFHHWTGTIPLSYNNGYLFATVTGPSGKTGTFAVDIGASKTIVTEDFLPKDIEVVESYMLEYSSKGARKLKYEPGGATGPVRTVKGQASLPSMTMGDIKLSDVTVDVITSLPELRGTAIDGIIGMDVMRAGGYLRLDYGSTRSSQPSLTVADKSSSEIEDCIALPYSRNGELMYVRGSVGRTPVYFILDSGAPKCLMSPQSLEMTGATLASDTAITYHGGGGQEWQGRHGIIDDLAIGGRPFPDQPFMIGEITVLQRLAKNQASGLLGNSFFSQFEAMEIDFQNNVVRFALQ